MKKRDPTYCGKCQKRKPEGGKRTCQVCLKSTAARNRDARRRRVKAGACANYRCDNPRAGKSVHCDACRLALSDRLLHYDKRSEATNAKRRAARVVANETGMCSVYLCKRPRTHGALCLHHRIIQRDSHRRAYQRAKAARLEGKVKKPKVKVLTDKSRKKPAKRDPLQEFDTVL